MNLPVHVPPDFNRFDRSKAIHIRARNLPHWKQCGATYFITFRLADSIPSGTVDKMYREASLWRARAEHEERSSGGTLPEAFMEDWESVQHRHLIKLESTMDAGHGSCLLADPANRNMIVEALFCFHRLRYTLHAFVIMPNHVHLSVTPRTGWEIDELLPSWKGFTSRQINQRISRQGTLWQRDSFNRIVRHEEHFKKVIHYIATNPAKAKLAPDTYTLWLGDCIEPASEGGLSVREAITQYPKDSEVW